MQDNTNSFGVIFAPIFVCLLRLSLEFSTFLNVSLFCSICWTFCDEAFGNVC